MTATLASFLSEPLSPDVTSAVERLRCTPGVEHVALTPDVHLAEDVCVGTVLSAADRIFPQAVGADIGCGMAAVRLAGGAEALREERSAHALLEALARVLPVQSRLPLEATDLLPPGSLSQPALARLERRIGRTQLATLGRGNHFVEIQADTEDQLWVMVHSGSRGLGPAVLDHHLRGATSTGTGLAWLDPTTKAGADYLRDVDRLLQWAAASRRLIAAGVGACCERILGFGLAGDPLVDCAHNLVRSERSGGGERWVHRKGAIPAAEGEPGLIPGSMGHPSYHVEGRGNPAALRSSSHGAGRRASRGEARRSIGVRALERSMKGVWFDRRLADRLTEEAPGAYRDIAAVMRAQRELTRIVRELRPVLSYKGT